MAVSVVMPALELAQDTGKLLAWRKQEGEAVKKGEALLEIETDKAVVEVEAPGDGVLAAISAKPGAVVPVGRTIAWLVQPGEAIPRRDDTEATETNGGHGKGTSVASIDRELIGDLRGTAVGLRISPKARRLAQERGVDLAAMKGSGPDGEILAADILAARKPEVSTLTPEVSTAARLMAERTTKSWTTVPHFFLSRDIDATALNAARERLTRVSHTDMLVHLVARALAAHPHVNASWIDNTIRTNADVNVAIAIAVDDAVVAGVIHHADHAELEEIAARRKELIDRARSHRLQPSDIAGATFTISNLGMYGVDAFTAIIVPPQAGILAVGAIADRVVAVDGRPAVRPMVTLTLSCDHRVVDGARAAAFLNEIAERIARA
jgi:pyruvate dehydrogenase E2 component (dihydrolipoamide acetyltransferase)